MNRTTTTLILSLVFGLAFAGAQQPDPAAGKALIFAMNLFALPVDVQWGDDGVYSVQKMFARTSARGVWVVPGIPRSVLFRRAGTDQWSSAKGPDGKPLTVALEAGGSYALVVRSNGNGELVKVESAATQAPKVLLVNAAREPVAVLRLGVSADGIAPGFGAFADAVPGAQTLTWAWPTMPPGTSQYQASSSQPGQPGVTRLTEGHWYVGIVSGINGQVTDVTP